MTKQELAHVARRVLSERLGRLRESMQELGAWFTEHVAKLIGQHVGEAVKDALAAALGRPARRDPDDDDDDGYSRHGARDPYATHDTYENDGDFWGRDAREGRGEKQAQAKSDRRRWDGVLACVAQVAAWWLRQGLPRASLVRVLALGAAAGLAALLLGPLAGGLIATAGTVLLAAGPPSVETSKPSR